MYNYPHKYDKLLLIFIHFFYFHHHQYFYYIGAVLGSGFHIIGGGYLRQQGRTTLNQKIIIKEASRAGLRLSSIIGGYTAVRCTLLSLTHSDSISCGIAGATAVAIPTILDPHRIQFLQTYYTNSLKPLLSNNNSYHNRQIPPLPKHFVIATSAFSGAIMFGGSDMLLHRLLGIRW